MQQKFTAADTTELTSAASLDLGLFSDLDSFLVYFPNVSYTSDLGLSSRHAGVVQLAWYSLLSWYIINPQSLSTLRTMYLTRPDLDICCSLGAKEQYSSFPPVGSAHHHGLLGLSC